MGSTNTERKHKCVFNGRERQLTARRSRNDKKNNQFSLFKRKLRKLRRAVTFALFTSKTLLRPLSPYLLLFPVFYHQIFPDGQRHKEKQQKEKLKLKSCMYEAPPIFKSPMTPRMFLGRLHSGCLASIRDPEYIYCKNLIIDSSKKITKHGIRGLREFCIVVH